MPNALRVLIGCLVALALALGVRSWLAAVRARRLGRQRTQLLEDVGLLQAALLPVAPARLGPVGTSVAYRPAAGPGAGGDFYDVFALEDGQLAVIVGDVSGHGRSALPHTALVRFTLRAYLEAGLSPRDALQTAGAVLERQLGGVFATVVAATYQPRERVLVYACAGHPPPIVLGGAADARAIAPVTLAAAPPIGVGMRTGTRQTVISVPGRSQVCFYTDGLTEARVDSELFGTERLLDTIAALGPDATAPAILDSVAESVDARPDDMAACLLSVEGDEQQPAVVVEELELDREEAESERTQRFLLACGLERHEVAEVVRSAAAAAGRAGTVVLELRSTGGHPVVTMQREQLSYIHARRADVGGGTVSARPVLAPDAAIALGIASTAMPFARTPEDEVERWLRVLRLHGQVGIALQGLGVSEEPLPAVAHDSDHERDRTLATGDRDAVARVTEHAIRIAAERGERALATTDILMAVMHVYGEDFDRVLQVHGTDRDEVLERLGLQTA